MPHFADYELYLCGHQGNQVILLTGPEMLEFKWSLTLNGPGVYSCTLVAESGIQDYFRKHYGLKLMRDYGDGFYEEFYGFHLSKREWLQSSEVDEHYWESRGLGPEWLLDQPLIWPIKSSNPNYQFYDMWWASGTADDVMKQMASESIGGGADEDRQFSNFVVEGNKGEGVYSCFEARFDRLLASMQDIAGDEYEADFRVVRTGAGFELRSYSPYFGTDRRRGTADPTIFSLELANMQNPEHMVDWREEVTYLIGGWQGTRAGQALYFAQDATAMAETPFSRREDFIDLQSLSQSDPIPDIMSNELYNRRKVETVSFELLQTDACLYGRDWNLGDLVTLDLWGYSYDMRITGVNGAIDGQNEETIVGIAELYGTGNIEPIYEIEPEVPAGGAAVAGGSGSAKFWLSVTDGETWTLAQTEAAISAVYNIIPTGSSLVAIASSSPADFYKSTDEGESWIAKDSTPVNRYSPYGLCVATNGNIAVATSGTGAIDGEFWLSTDGGESYSYVSTVAGASVVPAGIVRASNGYLYATWEVFAWEIGRVYRSTNHGASWTNIADLDLGAVSLGISVNDDLITGYEVGGVVRSTNGGITWNDVGDLAAVIVYSFLTLDDGTMLAGMSDGEIWSSANDGANWSLLSSDLPAAARDLCQLPTGTVLAACGVSGIWRSTDGGTTWAAATGADTVYCVSPTEIV